MLVKSILMVCQGNICRSPMAEGLFLHELKKQTSLVCVSSAGLTALVGYHADQHAKQVMLKQGIDISAHQARQLDPALVSRHELILAMTDSHCRSIEKKFLSAKGKTFLLGQWNDEEIEDPYGQAYEKFERVFHKIQCAWQHWKLRIIPECQQGIV